MSHKIFRLVKCSIGLLSSILSEPRITFARQDPFRFRDFSILDFEPQRRNNRPGGLFQQSEVAGVPCLGIKVAALHFSKTCGGFPKTCTETPYNSILRLPKPDGKRRRRRLVQDNGVEILVQHCLQTSTIARRPERASCKG